MIRDIWFSIPCWLQAVCLGFLCVWTAQLLYIFMVRMRPLWRLGREKKHKVPFVNELPPISLIIYTHNQSEKLLQNLPVLLDSHYPDFEVIVVDDGSTDDTENVLRQMDQRSEHFFHTTIAERLQTVSHHKMAMLLGVKAAHNNIILMTQAQCVPASRDWLTAMGRLFTPKVDAVVGPVVYEGLVGVQNRFFQWDYFDRMLTMMGLTLSVKTYGGWSCNLAFRKEVFFADKNRAIQRYLGMHPGEDDLFLAEITKKKNVTVACSADALVINQQSPIAYNWKQERLNRAFTHRFYCTAPRTVRAFEIVSRYLCMLSGLALIGSAAWLQSWWTMGVAILLYTLYLVSFVLVPYFMAKKLYVHRYVFSPLFYGLITPLVDLAFSVHVLLRSHRFYVGRID